MGGLNEGGLVEGAVADRVERTVLALRQGGVLASDLFRGGPGQADSEDFVGAVGFDGGSDAGG